MMKDSIVDAIMQCLVFGGVLLFVICIILEINKIVSSPEYGTIKDYDIKYCRLIYSSNGYRTTPCIEVAYDDKVAQFYTDKIKISDSCFVREKKSIDGDKELYLTLDTYNQILDKGGD